MDAYELADRLDLEPYGIYGEQAANILRQQADRIERKQELIREQTALLAKQNNRIAELEKQLKVKESIYSAEPYLSDWSKRVKEQYSPQIKELSDEEIKLLLDRIQNYLECGGFFNPECMEHDKVRDLIMDCRAILKKASEK